MSAHSMRMHADIRAITKSLKVLARHLGRLAPLLGEHQDVVIVGKRSRPQLSARHRAALKLQGRYMGLLRGLRPRQAAAVKRVRAEKGVRAAIAAARRVAG